MKNFQPIRRGLLFALLLTNVALLVTGCGDAPVEKTADPTQVEENRKKYEEMSRVERAS